MVLRGLLTAAHYLRSGGPISTEKFGRGAFLAETATRRKNSENQRENSHPRASYFLKHRL